MQTTTEIIAPVKQVAPCEAPVKPEVVPKPKVNTETLVDRELQMKNLIEKSIVSGELFEPLYHRQQSHGRFIPTLPLPYWKSLFSYEFSESDRIPLSDIYVLAHTVDINENTFAQVLSFMLNVEKAFANTKLLGIIYSVALSSRTQLPASQAKPLSNKVLYSALNTTDIKAINSAEINACGTRIADTCIQLPNPPNFDSLTLAKDHPLHLFTRFPSFQAYHNKQEEKPCSLAPETTLAVLAPPYQNVELLMQSCSSAGLDIVGCKLCVNADFDSDLCVPQEITSSNVHLALAFRGQSATAKLRDVMFSHSIAAYVPHGVLQSKRNLVYWFGGRVATNCTPLPLHLPHPRQLYSLIFQPEETLIASLPSNFQPKLLGRILDVIAGCGYNLTEMKRLENGTILIAMAKENGRGKHHIQFLNQAMTDIIPPIELLTTLKEVHKAIERCRASTLPLPRVGLVPTLFVDYEREQTLFGIIHTGTLAQRNTQMTQNIPETGQILFDLLVQADECHLLGLKLVPSTQVLCEYLASMSPTYPREIPKFTPTGKLLLVVFRQLVPEGNFKKSFERVKTSCVIYAQPSVANSMISSLFEMDELFQHKQSQLDLCYPDHCLPCFQLQKTVPLDSIVIIKPATNATLLPVLLRRLRRDNFTIVEMHMTVLTSSQVIAMFGNNQETLDYMTSQPCVVMLTRRNNGISRLMQLVGPPDPHEARANARFSLIAGYGIDLIHNAIYTSRSYLKAQADIETLYSNTTTNSPLACSMDDNQRTFVVTPKTLVETTLVLLTGPLVNACGTILPWLIDEGEFRLVNIQQSPSLTPSQKLFYASRLTYLDGPIVALALERDNAVSRMISFLQVSPSRFIPTNTAETARDKLAKILPVSTCHNSIGLLLIMRSPLVQESYFHGTTRATPGDHIPSDAMVHHYAARADAGLIITECTMITPLTSTFYSEPGVYSAEQFEAWKKVTDAVHAEGGKIFCQICHSGRAAHPALNDGVEAVGLSPIAVGGLCHTPEGKIPNVTPP
ncbi:12-oxophytodienoate reductase [Thraustotheca clavata]|uniref:12-oxophytodienoate reductase n=1 Tax=Thraustotheca clavata TaxID=74557 RepID=A0A1V9ZKM5_9STRA|nr:12-oxophytodienoate reductase [Thraustotheca clavata]